MPKARRYLLVVAVIAALCSAAERRSWNKVQYVGGTLPIKTSPYDWNTTITVTSNPDTVLLVIAPASVFGHQQTVHLKPSQITKVICGSGAWQRIADVSGSQLPAKRPTLFGLLLDYSLVGIIYQGDDGKTAAVLLNALDSASIGRILEAVTGKPTEYGK